MSLSVGAVQIDYCIRPHGAAYRYAQALAEYDGHECWKMADMGGAFIEMDEVAMVEHASNYIASHGLSPADAEEVMSWIIGLPWRSGVVMLHFGW